MCLCAGAHPEKKFRGGHSCRGGGAALSAQEGGMPLRQCGILPSGGDITPLESGILPFEGGMMVTEEGGMPPSDGGFLPSEGGMPLSKSDILHSEGGITRIVNSIMC